MPYPPRQIVLNVLNTIDASDYHLDKVISDLVDEDINFSQRDRNLVNILVYGVLRWRNLLDWIISQYASTRVDKIDPDILNILRIGLFQIFFLERIPVSAAVNTSVDITKRIAPSWVVGFVNALLRNAVRNKESLTYPNIEKEPYYSIPITMSFPVWLTQRWLNRFGTEETVKLCNACNQIPPLTVRVNTLKSNRDELFAKLKTETGSIKFTSYSSEGLLCQKPRTAVHKMKTFAEGMFQVQDEAAQLISYLLDPRPGEKILDACAGLGGKTGHMAQLMKNHGYVIALDKNPQKIFQLNTEMNRLGIKIVSSKIIDLKKPILKKELGGFDRILLDAPCSGLGVIRRNPDIKWDKARQNLNRYQTNQLNLLCQTSQLLNPQGVIVYSVCSFEPEENEEVVFAFLKTHQNFKIHKKFRPDFFNLAIFLDDDGFFRSFPHRHDMDGFFAVCLKRFS